MIFDVTNGVRTLTDLRIDFIVIPAALLLSSQPLIVNEGKLVTRIIFTISQGSLTGLDNPKRTGFRLLAQRIPTLFSNPVRLLSGNDDENGYLRSF